MVMRWVRCCVVAGGGIWRGYKDVGVIVEIEIAAATVVIDAVVVPRAR